MSGKKVTVHPLSEMSVCLKIKVKFKFFSNESNKIIYISNVKE